MINNIRPKILTGAKLKGINKKGHFVFSSDGGWWSIPPDMLEGITDRDIYATGKLVRFTKNGKDKYRWIEDVTDEPIASQTSQSAKQDRLSKGLNVGKSLVNRFFD